MVATENAAGSIGGVGSGGVVELCLTFPLFHSSTHIATGKMPVVPVAHRMPKGAPMSGFEKPPRGRRLCPRRRAVDCAAVGNVKMWNCGSVKVWKYENGVLEGGAISTVEFRHAI